MKFRPDNKMKFYQNLGDHCGIPSGVEFVVDNFLGKDAFFTLTGYGHGILDVTDNNSYGKGKLYVYGLTAKQKKRFTTHMAEQQERAQEVA